MGKSELINDSINNALVEVELLGSSDEMVDEILEDLEDDINIISYYRYAFRSVVPKNPNWYEETLANLDDNRFKMIVRMTREQFNLVLDLIKDHEVFHGENSELQFSPFFQLTLVLFRLGSSGDNASRGKIATLFGIVDGGTLQKVTKRVFQSILAIGKDFLNWPSDEDRKQLTADTFEELPHCVGYLDGTEIELDEAPSLDPTSYFSRKKRYAIKLQAICDHKLRIRSIVVGYPGSVHNSRIFNNSGIGRNPSKYLSEEQWIAADSAYRLTTSVLTPFRQTPRALTAEKRTKFNKHFGKYRVRIEHCFGILKEKFSSLKKLKLKITNDDSHKFACTWIRVCCILYNIILPHLSEEDLYFGDNIETSEENADSLNLASVTTDKLGELKRQALYEVIFEK